MLLVTVFSCTQIQEWKIQNNYSIRFSSNEASGFFEKLKGVIIFDEEDLTVSKIEMTINVAFINTGIGLEDSIAKSEYFFEAIKYPYIKFTSTKIEKEGVNYKTTGTLSMHGINKEIVIPFVFKKSNKEAIFTGSFNVNRNDFHLGEPGEEISEIIKIDVKVPVKKIN